MVKSCLLFAILNFMLAMHASAQQVFCAKIPGYTGYAIPSQEGVVFDELVGCTKWSNPDIAVQYHMQINGYGDLGIRLMLSNDGDAPATVSVRFGDITKELKVPPTGGVTKYVLVDAGLFLADYPGFYTVRVKPLTKTGEYYPGIMNVQMYATFADKISFATVPDRNASAVNLTYLTPKEHVRAMSVNASVPNRYDYQGTRVVVVGNELMRVGMANESIGKYIFFTWKNVKGYKKPEFKYSQFQRYQIDSSRIHQTRLMIPYNWSPDQQLSLSLIHHKDSCTKSESWEARVYNEKKKEWHTLGLIAVDESFSPVRDWYSAISNPEASSGYLERKALFSNPIVVLQSGIRKRINQARFGHDTKGKRERCDYGAGSDADTFWLSTGGFSFPQASYGKVYEVKASSGKKYEDRLTASF